MRYTVIIESGENNLSAYVPDLPGCVAVGDSEPEILTNMREAIQFHLDGMREDGEEIPEPTTRCTEVEVGGWLRRTASKSWSDTRRR